VSAIQCKTEYKISGGELAAIGVNTAIETTATISLWKGAGCDVCHKSGYKGRVGVYEVMEISEEMKQLVVKKATPSEIRTAAARTGVECLRDVALKKMMAGLTTIDEVVRVTVAESNAE
jgi:type II secretory ATPase GspE/PulE/Tfp pilus assembly ATPase PilB-like protein